MFKIIGDKMSVLFKIMRTVLQQPKIDPMKYVLSAPSWCCSIIINLVVL